MLYRRSPYGLHRPSTTVIAITMLTLQTQLLYRRSLYRLNRPSTTVTAISKLTLRTQPAKHHSSCYINLHTLSKPQNTAVRRAFLIRKQFNRLLCTMFLPNGKCAFHGFRFQSELEGIFLKGNLLLR